MLSLPTRLDHVFSGESEKSFPKFLSRVRQGERWVSKVIEGEPCLDLDGLPLPDFAEYYEQLRRYLPDSVLQDAAMVWLPYETSRGCWWVQSTTAPSAG